VLCWQSANCTDDAATLLAQACILHSAFFSVFHIHIIRLLLLWGLCFTCCLCFNFILYYDSSSRGLTPYVDTCTLSLRFWSQPVVSSLQLDSWLYWYFVDLTAEMVFACHFDSHFNSCFSGFQILDFIALTFHQMDQNWTLSACKLWFCGKLNIISETVLWHVPSSFDWWILEWSVHYCQLICCLHLCIAYFFDVVLWVWCLHKVELMLDFSW